MGSFWTTNGRTVSKIIETAIETVVVYTPSVNGDTCRMVYVADLESGAELGDLERVVGLLVALLDGLADLDAASQIIVFAECTSSLKIMANKVLEIVQ
eukprot:SAG22_NODE_7466_length_736_cov_2.094192_1_plen_98_part_00